MTPLRRRGMCGIAGMLGADDPALAAAMAGRLSHRGPDGSGWWEDEVRGVASGSIAFGHARLAIVDLAGSNQPIASDHGCVLVQNGEIYGHRGIRELERGYSWRTSGDAESILAAHSSAIAPPGVEVQPVEGSTIGWFDLAKGAGDGGGAARRHVEWVRRLDGIWGFALWDPRWRELILCRDPLGVKPLLRTQTESGTLLFASEAKAFGAHPNHDPRLDLLALVQRLAYEYPLDCTTLFEGVSQVAAGTVETWSLDAAGRAVCTGVASHSRDIISPASHWDPVVGAEHLLESLRLDVADRLMSDVPVGIVLSGGLDSSLIAALAHEAAEIAGKPIPGCYTVTESEDNPDHMAAQEVASSLDLEHSSWKLDESVFHNRLPDLGWHGEDLDVTVVFFQPLFDRMSEDVTVGLCGQGADELHAGYPRYLDPSAHASLVRKRLDSVEDATPTKVCIGPVQPWQERPPEPEIAFADLTSMLQFELDRGQLSNFQLRLVDRHSMAHGLEVRVPFLGYRHRTAAHCLPNRWRLDRGLEKIALRKAAALTDLPSSIVDRPKLPAGTATAPRLLAEFLEEMRPRAMEWAEDTPILAPVLRDQPEMAIGLRLFSALHLSGAEPRQSSSLLDILDDADPVAVPAQGGV